MRHAERVVCETCGVEFVTRRKDAKYCSHACANDKNRDGILFKKDRWDKFACPHNHAVFCSVRDCDNCGWNPAVEKTRRAKIKQKLGVAEA